MANRIRDVTENCGVCRQFISDETLLGMVWCRRCGLKAHRSRECSRGPLCRRCAPKPKGEETAAQG